MSASGNPVPPGPISGPEAWYGPDLAGRNDWMRRFSDAELTELDAAIRAFRQSGRPLAELSPATFPLPALGPRLAEVLRELTQGRGFILMRGFPVERYSREETAIAYMGIGSHFGSFRSQNAKGHLLGHVRDLGYDVANPNVRYYQTSRGLDYHTDSVDIVGLICLKKSKSGGESFIASSTTCFNEILKRRPDLAPHLFDPYPTDRRGEVPVGMKPWFDIPIFHWHAERLSVSFSGEYIDAAQKNFPEAKRLTPGQREVLEMLRQLVNDPAIHLSMAFEPGDMQFLHNHQILHARNEFENWPEPERHRHLLRLWLCPQGGRPLPPSFEPRYGSVTPGDRGGIVVKNMQFKVVLEPE
jgi:hypothetical protein